MILVLFVAVFCVGSIAYIKHNLQKIYNPGDIACTTKTSKVHDKKNINILLLGVDRDPNTGRDTNSDAMIFINYNREKESIKLFSIPRDTYVEFLDTNVPKINSAYAKGGAAYSKQIVSKFFDMPVDYYIRGNYIGFRRFIDAIGGVDITIPRDMNYDDYAQDLHIHFNKGENTHLDGKKAEEYIRWRKNNDNSGFADGDIGRIKKFQGFADRVIDKLKSPLIITKINKITKSFTENVETDIPPEAIIKYGLEFIKINKDNINMKVLPGAPQYIYNKYQNANLSYYVVDQNTIQNIKSQIMN